MLLLSCWYKVSLACPIRAYLAARRAVQARRVLLHRLAHVWRVWWTPRRWYHHRAGGCGRDSWLEMVRTCLVTALIPGCSSSRVSPRSSSRALRSSSCLVSLAASVPMHAWLTCQTTPAPLAGSPRMSDVSPSTDSLSPRSRPAGPRKPTFRTCRHSSSPSRTLAHG